MILLIIIIIILSFITISISDINNNNLTTINNNNQSFRINVYHFTINYWAESIDGDVKCDKNIKCNWAYSDHLKVLRQKWLNDANNSHYINNNNEKFVTVGVYNIHSWWERHRDPHPAYCDLYTNLTLAESQESRVRYSGLFDATFKFYDGYSTTHPESNIPRVYVDAYINKTNFLSEEPLKHSQLIKGGSYIASDCHKRDNANANRDTVVALLRLGGLRIDGLGRCMHTPTGPEGIELSTAKEDRYNMNMKKKAISRYMFNMAFENSIEPGYVTEKPFDPLLTGTVPVYLGDAATLKSLLPDPKAAIYVADFNNNMTALAEYLIYLTTNETAYEVHRQWRKTFSYEKNIQKPLMEKGWFCDVCIWAANSITNLKVTKNKKKHCELAHSKNASSALEGKVIRHNKGKLLYFVENGLIRTIPDMNTFLAMKFNYDEVIALSDHEIKQLKQGEPLPKRHNFG